MFGGLELKSGKEAEDGDGSDDATKAAPPAGSSAFSFLMSSTAAPAPAAAPSPSPSPAAAPAAAPAASSFGFLSGGGAEASPSSAFSFISGAGASSPTSEDKPGAKGETTTGGPSSESSAFSFLSSAAASTSAPPPGPPQDAPEQNESKNAAGESNDSGSVFSFLASSITSSAPAPAPVPQPQISPSTHDRTDATSPSRESALPASAATSPAWGPSSNATAASAATKSSTTTTTTAKSLSSSLDNTPKNVASPTGAGIVFGGAATKKGAIKKRSRSKRVGVMNTPASPPTSSPMPPPPPPPPPTPADNGDDNSRQAAEEAAANAEQFMRQKATDTTPSITDPHNDPDNNHQHHQDDDNHDNQDKGSFVPPSLSKTPSSPSPDQDFQTARAAAEEARASMAAMAKRTTSAGTNEGPVATANAATARPAFGSGRRIMDSLFKPVGFFNNNNNNNNNESKHSRNSTSPPPEETNHQENEKPDQIQKEQEQPKRLAAEREISQRQNTEEDDRAAQHLQRQRQQAQEDQEKKAKEQIRKAELEEQKRREEEEASKLKTPQEVFLELLQDFADGAGKAMDRVGRLRHQKTTLLEQGSAAEKLERLATQHIKQAESQQTAAAENEDFELADRLAAVIDKHDFEKDEQRRILDSISKAVATLDEQRDDVVQSVSRCFLDVKDNLMKFKEEQENSEKQDGTEAMEKFSAMSKRLFAEDERLTMDLKHLERNEELVAEERKELEATITEQSGDIESTRDDAKTKLDSLNEEIELLRAKLGRMEAEATELRAEVEAQDSAIEKIRTKFSRQLNRLSKKEAALNENRIEWDLEKKSFTQLREAHEAAMQAHSEALLAHDEMMKSIQEEVATAETLEDIILKEVAVEIAGDGHDAENAIVMKDVQADVVRCEAGVDEANQLLMAAQAAVESLSDEVDKIDARIPLLESEKKSAASMRDFKSAAKASKELKELIAKRNRYQDELDGEAKEKLETAKHHLEQIKSELETKKKIAEEKERENCLEKMGRLADRVTRLRRIRREVCGDIEVDENDIIGVIRVGAFVLEAEAKALVAEGETFGDKFGGWEELLAKAVAEEAAAQMTKEKESKEKEEQTEETSVDAAPEKLETVEENGHNEKKESSSQINDAETEAEDHTASPKPSVQEGEKHELVEDEPKKSEPTPEAAEKYRELTKRIHDAELALEEAVEKEDFEIAAELDETIQELKGNLESLGLSDDDIKTLSEGDVSVINNGGDKTDNTPTDEEGKEERSE